MVLTAACETDTVRFGTEEYRRLDPEAREVVRRDYLREQGNRADRLSAACVNLGTVHGDVAARQYGQWVRWARLAENDPVLTEHVLTLWRKEYSRARKMRHRMPKTMEDLAAWLSGRQNTITGSWAHPEAPMWLAVGETAEAMRILGWDEGLPDDVDPPLFLAIVHSSEAARTVMGDTYDGSRRAGLAEPVREMAWLPWLRWVSRDVIGFHEEWDREVRQFCDERLLDAASGGYKGGEGDAMDLVVTYRLAMGWNIGSDVLSWLPSPQAMAASIMAAADTLGESLRPAAAALLVGAVADLDSLASRRTCDLLGSWARHAAELITPEAHGEPLLSSMRLLRWVGAGRGPSREWLAQAGCTMALPTYPMARAFSGSRGASAPRLTDLETHVLMARRGSDET